jgi:negative regulator of sigma E activity
MQQERISDYIDNLLPTIERQRVADHLAACSNCRVLHEDFTLIVQTSRSLPQPEPSERVWQGILQAITAEPVGIAVIATSPRQPWLSSMLRLGLWRPVYAAAAMLVLATAVGITLFRPAAPVDQPTAITETSQPSPLAIQRKSYIAHIPNIEIGRVQQRINQLQKHIARKEVGWSPEVRSLFRQRLAFVDDCISNCLNGAAEKDNQGVREVYRATLQAKLDMLSQFAEF